MITTNTYPDGHRRVRDRIFVWSTNDEFETAVYLEIKQGTSPVTTKVALTADQARALAADLIAQADHIDPR